ncbi:hypothetical protein ABZX85_11805 [Streptomyces sp. NPDC004539]|uniref:hypothetical protein n=1 Tax=Streptomyces sp. NPDC004539 TaxID=3154280 RepID=UPI0033A97DD6
MPSRTLRTAAAAALTAGLILTFPQPAQAAKRCVSQSGSVWYDLASPYSGSLNGAWVTLQTARSNGAARAIVHPGSSYRFRSGDILSIDRSIRELPKYDPQTGKPWKTHRIEQMGGWDYCESTLHSTDSIRTGPIDGLRHATRVCLRRGTSLQCTNDWYVDTNG